MTIKDLKAEISHLNSQLNNQEDIYEKRINQLESDLKVYGSFVDILIDSRTINVYYQRLS